MKEYKKSVTMTYRQAQKLANVNYSPGLSFFSIASKILEVPQSNLLLDRTDVLSR